MQRCHDQSGAAPLANACACHLEMRRHTVLQHARHRIVRSLFRIVMAIRRSLAAVGCPRCSAKCAVTIIVLWLSGTCSGAAGELFALPAETLRDKIRGGLLGQMLGNLNGLPHEMKYINEPGTVTGYAPALPGGAWTDDDTDFEWVYILEMQRNNAILLPEEDIANLWRQRINQRIWCSNQYARQLMDLGIDPPLTGNALLNPWAEFNISGQFLCETFGLIAPGMPQTASRIGLHYTRVAIDGEPAQTTQLFDSMIACAFRSQDLEELLDAGEAALDPDCVIREIVRKVRQWHRESAGDWRLTRARIMETYSRHDGAMRDRNGYELNTASTIGSLLHGEGDFARTLELAFNFGWDCDNNAATAGTILGVIKGYRWMLAQGWPIVDRYRNETREEMPEDETITSFADRLIDLADRVIIQQGGHLIKPSGQWTYLIPTEPGTNVMKLLDRSSLLAQTRATLEPQIRAGLESVDRRERARAAYLAICLELDGKYRDVSPARWNRAIEDLAGFDQISQVLFHHSPVPAAGPLQKKAMAAGLEKPPQRRELW